MNIIYNPSSALVSECVPTLRVAIRTLDARIVKAVLKNGAWLYGHIPKKERHFHVSDPSCQKSPLDHDSALLDALSTKKEEIIEVVCDSLIELGKRKKITTSEICLVTAFAWQNPHILEKVLQTNPICTTAALAVMLDIAKNVESIRPVILYAQGKNLQYSEKVLTKMAQFEDLELTEILLTSMAQSAYLYILRQKESKALSVQSPV